MADNSILLDGTSSILFIGNSYTFGRVNPVMSYNTGEVRDLTAPMAAANSTGSNPYEPHPWGGVPGVFNAFADQSGLTLDVAISARNAATLQGHYLNSNPAGWTCAATSRARVGTRWCCRTTAPRRSRRAPAPSPSRPAPRSRR